MNYTNLQNVNAEIRAYIYQQLADIEQLLPEGSEISIFINDNDKKKIETNIKIETPFGEIHAFEESPDIFESLSQAKENLVKQLSEIHRATGEQDPETDQLIQAIVDKRLIH
jgi:ribosomal subunit interface protein